jgi:hypothetical protein
MKRAHCDDYETPSKTQKPAAAGMWQNMQADLKAHFKDVYSADDYGDRSSSRRPMVSRPSM